MNNGIDLDLYYNMYLSKIKPETIFRWGCLSGDKDAPAQIIEKTFEQMDSDEIMMNFRFYIHKILTDNINSL